MDDFSKHNRKPENEVFEQILADWVAGGIERSEELERIAVYCWLLDRTLIPRFARIVSCSIMRAGLDDLASNRLTFDETRDRVTYSAQRLSRYLIGQPSRSGPVRKYAHEVIADELDRWQHESVHLSRTFVHQLCAVLDRMAIPGKPLEAAQIASRIYNKLSDCRELEVGTDALTASMASLSCDYMQVDGAFAPMLRETAESQE
ncbi:MAG: hypothetical protein Q8P30_00515 [Candidatus Uhrbacteria bacterium]|nr:hypothetical protein [Candidatus Uhrbacteria bacterium]